MTARPRSNRLGMYADVRQILDAALQSGGGSYECPDHGQAVHWRQRAYRFRKLYAEILGVDEESVYDCIVMPRIEQDSATVMIKVRRQVGRFTPSEDGPSPVAPLPDELFDVAAELAAKLEKDGL